MQSAFALASLWSAGCSAFGAGVINLLLGCPACAPVINCPTVAAGCPACAPAFSCPAVACYCTSGPATPAAVCAPGVTSWASLLASFVAGALVALAAAWRLRLWAVGGWDVAGRFSLGGPGQGDSAPSIAVGTSPRRALSASPPLPSGRSGVAAIGPAVAVSVSGDLAVWKPRGP